MEHHKDIRIMEHHKDIRIMEHHKDIRIMEHHMEHHKDIRIMEHHKDIRIMEHGTPQGHPHHGTPQGHPHHGTPQGHPHHGTPNQTVLVRACTRTSASWNTKPNQTVLVRACTRTSASWNTKPNCIGQSVHNDIRIMEHQTKLYWSERAQGHPHHGTPNQTVLVRACTRTSASWNTKPNCIGQSVHKDIRIMEHQTKLYWSERAQGHPHHGTPNQTVLVRACTRTSASWNTKPNCIGQSVHKDIRIMEHQTKLYWSERAQGHPHHGTPNQTVLVRACTRTSASWNTKPNCIGQSVHKDIRIMEHQTKLYWSERAQGHPHHGTPNPTVLVRACTRTSASWNTKPNCIGQSVHKDIRIMEHQTKLYWSERARLYISALLDYA